MKSYEIAAEIKPSKRQLEWQKTEFYGFINLGLPTVVNREWTDGNIKAEDARTILRAAVGLTSLEGKRFTAGDVDGNNKITSADARLTLRAAVGLEDFFKKK